MEKKSRSGSRPSPRSKGTTDRSAAAKKAAETRKRKAEEAKAEKEEEEQSEVVEEEEEEEQEEEEGEYRVCRAIVTLRTSTQAAVEAAAGCHWHASFPLGIRHRAKCMQRAAHLRNSDQSL